MYIFQYVGASGYDTSYSPDSGSIFFKIEKNGDKYSIFVHDVISSDGT